MFVLVPYLLTKKGWGYYLAAIVSIFLIIFLVGYVLSDYSGYQVEKRMGPPIALFILIITFSVSTSIRLNNDRIKNKQLQKEKEYESLKSELSLLRSQITPHFMFNVLNTLASLARKKSDDIEDVIIKISTLMRYMLYNKSEKNIDLEHEIEYLNIFIEIQKLRFGEYIKITTSIDVGDSSVFIEPMLFIPLIENAFKHGVGTVARPMIEIQLTLEDGALDFIVKNRFNPEIAPEKETSGIGIHNIKKRLSFLYEDKHELLTFTEGDLFTATLKLIL